MQPGADALRPLPVEFFQRDVQQVAQELLGLWLVRRLPQGLVGGRIVEVEAYLGYGDPASHSYQGPNRKNASMFGPGGRAYVYPIHSRWCMNVVTDTGKVPWAVLIRALEPLLGVELMAQRRGTNHLRLLATGPARLCEALGIDRSLDGWNLTRGQRLWVAQGDGQRPSPEHIVRTPRIGVTAAQDELLRFVDISRETFLSGPRHLHRSRMPDPQLRMRTSVRK